MSNKRTSTAALASFRRGPLPNQRRNPRHPPGARTGSRQRSKKHIGERHKEIQQAQLAIYKEDVMNSGSRQHAPRNFTTIFPVILRITFSLILWTLGAANMNLTPAETPPREHRVVKNFPVDRPAAENLQRWVNAGHDDWCRDPQLVAAATLRRVSPELSELEPTSLSLQLQLSRETRAIYTLHSLDGRITYRITLRRYRFLLPTAGSLRQMIWVPERAEIVTTDTRDNRNPHPLSPNNEKATLS
jgi:hypothetical protein